MVGQQKVYETVISGGRVVDPASGLDGVRNIGIADGTVQVIAQIPLRGNTTLEASDLVVSAGFIDLHSHGHDRENYEAQALDGVTTTLELEVGTGDIDDWYAQRDGKTLVNYGASIGHIPARIDVMRDRGDFIPLGDAAYRAASESEITEIKRQIERGLKRGAPAVGLGLQYTPAASHWEALEVFRVAARYGASCHVHMRGMGHQEPLNSIEGLEELIAAASITGAAVHVVHISSSGMRSTPQLLQMIGEAQSRGIDVTTECYPYTAGMTLIESSILDEGWQTKLGVGYGELEWAGNGERLTAESFERYREVGGMVILHMIPEDVMQLSVASPLTAFATDGLLKDGKGHPRTAGSYSRVLGRHVRDAGTLTLLEALRKMTLLPAQRLEARVPMMKKKGRIGVGADADLVAFDPRRVIDRSTYQHPARPSDGIKHVLVNGVPVVRDGQLQEGVAPGNGVRAPAA